MLHKEGIVANVLFAYVYSFYVYMYVFIHPMIIIGLREWKNERGQAFIVLSVCVEYNMFDTLKAMENPLHLCLNAYVIIRKIRGFIYMGIIRYCMPCDFKFNLFRVRFCKLCFGNLFLCEIVGDLFMEFVDLIYFHCCV